MIKFIKGICRFPLGIFGFVFISVCFLGIFLFHWPFIDDFNSKREWAGYTGIVLDMYNWVLVK